MARLLAGVLVAAALASCAAIAYARTPPYPEVTTMDGPVTAVSGEEVTYTVHYRLLDPSTLPGAGFIIVRPEHTTFVSSQVVAGQAGRFDGAFDISREVVWCCLGSAEQTEGAVELVVRIDSSYVGTIRSGCYKPGTETANPEDHCLVETQVYAPGTLPNAGTGTRNDSLTRYVVLLALLGGALLIGGAAVARVAHRKAETSD